jgi:ribosomal protein S18 acetylase RimI-like enzyme
MVVFKQATSNDAERIAKLHALSWQQNYRQAFSAHFLDNEVVNDRLTVWKVRFEHPKENQYILIAEENGAMLGFLCAYFEENPNYGTYLDNLHVGPEAKGKGVGTQLMAKLSETILERNYTHGFYLWVLDTNYAAITFYDRVGGERLESVEANDIGDQVFSKTRYVWKNMDDFLKLVESKRRD